MTLAIIDGDVLAYRSCYSVYEQRLKAIERIKGDTLYIELDEEGKKKPIEFPKEVERKYLETAWRNFNFELREILDSIYATEYLMVVKGDDNFRNLLYPEYKLNRFVTPEKTNIFVPTIRKLAVAEDLAIESTGREADDYIRIWAEEARAAGDPFVICTIDKDLRCIPGQHYHLKYKTFEVVSEEEARIHYYEQMIKGDSTDNIPGVPGIGKKKAYDMIAACQDEDEMQFITVTKYMEAFGDDWYDMLLSNAKMIHLQRDLSDYFKADWPYLVEMNRERLAKFKRN